MKRRTLLGLGATILAALAVAWRIGARPPRPSARAGSAAPLAARGSTDPAPRPAPAARAAAPTVRVDEVIGVVERAGASGAWTAISSDTAIGVDESLRTAEGASARLIVGEHATIDLASASEVAVREITRSVHRFQLARGRVSARYAADGRRVLRVEGADGQVVETSEGTLGIVETGAALAVAAVSGSATLTASGETVRLTAGSHAAAAGDGAPQAPEPIPVAVLLRVADSDPPRPGDRSALVRGKASVGARVTVNGHAATVNARGEFEVRIPVREGTNRVVAWVEDALGRSIRRVLPPIVIDRSGPIDDVDIRWGLSRSAP